MRTDAVLTSILQRDHVIVGSCVVALVVLSWSQILHSSFALQAATPGMMDMSTAWTLRGAAQTFGMWTIMMIGMMTPSAAPMLLVYARVGEAAARHGKTLAATGVFASGYLLAWVAFAFVATTGQWALQRGLLLTPMLGSASSVFSGAVLIAAGVYQWTPLKHACLWQCQAPFAFIQRHGGFQGSARGALSLGLRHGLHCVGCCWALMALLFVGGVMNPLWIALITFFVLLEKCVPSLRWLPRLAGALLVAGGAWLFVVPP